MIAAGEELAEADGVHPGHVLVQLQRGERPAELARLFLRDEVFEPRPRGAEDADPVREQVLDHLPIPIAALGDNLK